MNHITILLTAVLLITACTDTPNQQPDTPSSAAEAPNSEAPVQAGMIDAAQVIEIEAGASGYSPDRIALKPGVPARLVFTRTAEAPCIQHVSIPAFGVEKTELPLNERKVIEIVPEEEGEYTFVCGMDMQDGSIVVSS